MPKTIDKKLALDLIELLSSLQTALNISDKLYTDYLFEDISNNLEELRLIVLDDADEEMDLVEFARAI